MDSRNSIGTGRVMKTLWGACCKGLFLCIGSGIACGVAAQPYEIDSRRELFVDRHLVEHISGEAELRMHRPDIKNVAITHDAPWEGSGSGYHSVFKDGDIYRLYYKAWQIDVEQDKVSFPNPGYLCYAESKDGKHFTKPDMGMVEFNGSTNNNIILSSETFEPFPIDTAHVAVTKDTNPDCPPDARYKAILRASSKRGLYAFKSPDGIHFSPMTGDVVITEGAFDSQNLAFWDPVREEYRAYWRDFHESEELGKRIRDIRTATSDDFLDWTDPVMLEYPGAPDEQLYINQILPYYRAPHIFMGFPGRYIERGWSESTRKLPQPELRKLRSSASNRFGMAFTDGLFMTSRDGKTFHRWDRAFIPPGLRTRDNWGYHDNFIAWGMAETASDTEGAPDQISLYAIESYFTGTASKLRRFTIRIDGFVSLQAPLGGGELITKPVIFEGDELSINFSTSAAGSVWIELQDADGSPIEGYAREDCDELFGDDLDRVVTWDGGSDVGSLSGKPVRLRFVLKDADVFSYQFRD